MTLAEATWCASNGVRLDSAEAAATPRQLPAVLALRVAWTTLCKGTRPVPRGIAASAQAAAAGDARLAAEGRAMLAGIP